MLGELVYLGGHGETIGVLIAEIITPDGGMLFPVPVLALMGLHIYHDGIYLGLEAVVGLGDSDRGLVCACIGRLGGIEGEVVCAVVAQALAVRSSQAELDFLSLVEWTEANGEVVAGIHLDEVDMLRGLVVALHVGAYQPRVNLVGTVDGDRLIR